MLKHGGCVCARVGKLTQGLLRTLGVHTTRVSAPVTVVHNTHEYATPHSLTCDGARFKAARCILVSKAWSTLHESNRAELRGVFSVPRIKA